MQFANKYNILNDALNMFVCERLERTLSIFIKIMGFFFF